jgi:hypothetical protein
VHILDITGEQADLGGDRHVSEDAWCAERTTRCDSDTSVRADLAAIFVELKSRRGKASKAQMKLREDIRAVGVKWCMARGARAAMVAVGHERTFQP